MPTARKKKSRPRKSETPRRRNPAQVRSKDTVDIILKAAAEVLMNEGWEHLNTNRVAERAGVSIGSLYQYFRNKEALVDALLQQHVDQHMELLATVSTAMQDAPMDVAVKAYVRAMFAAHSEHPRMDLALMEHLPRQHGWQAVMDLNTRAQTLVGAYLSLHAHEIRPRNLELASFFLVITVDAVMHGCLLKDPAMMQDEEVMEELSALVLGYLRTGVQPHPARGSMLEQVNA